MEPTIYKPSIYNGAGIYKTGAGGGGGSGLEPNEIAIGDFTYKAVTINDQIWTVRNFESEIPGVSKGAQCRYYNNDDATYGIYGQNRGMLYECSAIDTIQNWLDENCPGWRIPSRADWNKLVTFCGGSNAAFKKCCDTRLWYNLSGVTNETGMSLIPTGRRYTGSFDALDNAFYLTTDRDGTFEYPVCLEYTQTVNIYTYNLFLGSGNAGALRFVKDA